MAESDRLWLSDRQVDLVTGDVVRAGDAIARLTTKERELLAYLAARESEDVPRADLLTDVWGYAPTARCGTGLWRVTGRGAGLLDDSSADVGFSAGRLVADAALPGL